MRKWRFSDTDRTTKWQRRGNWLYFLAAWNAFGVMVYSIYTKKKAPDPEWAALTHTQRFLRMTEIGKDSDSMERWTIEGLKFSNIKKETITFDQAQGSKPSEGKEEEGSAAISSEEKA